MNWNPFSHLVKSKKYKLAHFIKSSWWERMRDTFEVFYGSNIPYRLMPYFPQMIFDRRMGILDYVFPLTNLFLLSHYFVRYVPLNIHLFKSIIVVSYAGILISDYIKFIAATLIASILTPIISLIHLCIQPLWNNLSNQIKNIIVHPVANLSTAEHSPIFEKRKYLRELDEDVFRNNIIFPITYFSKYYHHFTRESFSPGSSTIFLGVYHAEYCTCCTGPVGEGKLRAVIEVNSFNWAGILAMLKTNTMSASKNIEAKPFDTNELDIHSEIDKQVQPYLAKHAFLNGTSSVERNKSSIKKFVKSRNYDPKLTDMIFQFVGYPRHNLILEPKNPTENTPTPAAFIAAR
jgi:hypothetical protein